LDSGLTRSTSRGARTAASAPVSAPPKNTASVTPSAKETAAPNVARPESPATDAATALSIVQREVAGCTRCPELAATRTQTVFGVGNPNARLCFLGEAPGADEDRQGEPFVGRSGQLLTKIIEACTLSRGDVYILNVIKCRPPGNRTPAPEEVSNCSEYLDRQLEIIRPEFICCLGLVAAQRLLKTKEPMARLRGKFHDYKGISVLCTYHPSYLLRNPAAKRDVWQDMQLLMQRMGIDLSRGQGSGARDQGREKSS
jgi:DNA polymerase